MIVISIVVLILLSLWGYCAGAVAKAGKTVELKPQIVDLFLVSAIWAGAIYSIAALDLNRWLVILLWLVISIIIGVVAVWPRKLPVDYVTSSKVQEQAPRGFVKRLWQSWASFSRRAGGFNGRIVLSFLFFIPIAPFALAVRLFMDPLSTKRRTKGTHWLPLLAKDVNLEQLRRQS